MRTFLAALAFLSVAFAVTDASAAPISKAVVTEIDDVGKTFRCRWQAKDWVFQTTRTTAFRLGTKPAGFADLKVGQTVRVFFHYTGRGRTADRVMITVK